MEINDLQDLLNSIGYETLTDNGSFWRTNAVYREGDNKTSLRIHKQTGNFQDFVGGVYGTIDDLIKITLKLDDVQLKSFYTGNKIQIKELVQKDKTPRIIMDKTWTDKELSNLLPHFKFYEDKGISKDILRYFRCGLAHSGPMNQRFVFPIFREDGLINGWSGRDMTGKKDAKWKHIGRKAHWIFPYYIGGECKEAIRKARSVILVESIGDMLALWTRGVKNVLVVFGLKLSPKQAAFIMGLDIDCVVIALNNDIESEVNRGKVAAQEMFFDLMPYLDVHKIAISLPESNDFGVISDEQFERWNANKYIQAPSVYIELLDILRFRWKNGTITKEEIQFGKHIKAHLELIS